MFDAKGFFIIWYQYCYLDLTPEEQAKRDKKLLKKEELGKWLNYSVDLILSQNRLSPPKRPRT